MFGQVIAPTAGAPITRIPPALLPPGLYLVRVQVGYGAKSGAESNMELRRGGDRIVQLDCPTQIDYTSPWSEYKLRLDGSQDLTVNAIAAAAGGQVFKATIIARLEP